MQGVMGQADFQDAASSDAAVGLQGGAPGAPKVGPKAKRTDDDEKYTTIMLRNIPNKYTRSMLIEQLHKSGFKGDIDYLYLPTDFANRCNVGYCFLNFRTPQARQRFMQTFDGVAAQTSLPGFNSFKVCQVTRAKWQGRDENVRRLRSGPELMTQLAAHPEWLPLLMDEDGNQEPFHIDEPGAAPLDPNGPRRQNRRNKGGNMDAAGTLEAWMMGMGGVDMGMMQSPGSIGKGRGKGRKGGKSGGDFVSNYGGFPMSGGLPMSAMPVPVMTEHGVQYVPYEAAYGGFAMPQMGMYGGFAGYPPYFGMDDADAGPTPHGRQAKSRGRGRGESGKGSADFNEPAQVDTTTGVFAGS